MKGFLLIAWCMWMGNLWGQVKLHDPNSPDTLLYGNPNLVVEDRDDRRQFYRRGGKSFSGVVKMPTENGGFFLWDVKDGWAEQQQVFYANGQLERIAQMEEGRVHGAFRMYFSNGLPYVEQYFDHGNPVGTWRRWDNTGILVEQFEAPKEK